MAVAENGNGVVHHGRTPISREQAKLRYLALGPQRSLRWLGEILDEEGLHVNKNTIREWSARDGWVEAAEDFDRTREQSLRANLAANAVDMDLRQVRIGRIMQDIATDQLGRVYRDIEKAGEEDDPVLTLAEIRALVADGVRIERLAAGASTSNATVTFNTHIQPVLVLFQQLVGTLPEELRSQLTRKFADGVNQIRDVVLLEGQS